jgi:hypothetical protein
MARRGPLVGRVLDAGGKPAGGVLVKVEPGPESLPAPLDTASLFAGRQATPDAVTDGHGSFKIAGFDWWNSPRLTLRATRGNDQAEWSGPGVQLGGTLELRLRTGALVGVAGRLVDPDRHPMKNARVALIRWQDRPRLSWFLTARDVRADGEGRFRVDGLARGESFSLVSGGPFVPGGGDGAGFESPRFATPAAGDAPALGDVVIHPLEGSEQVLQLYGFDSPEQLAQLASLLPPPGPEQERAARQALERYAAALAAGDVDAALRLTAHASSGGAMDRQRFLLRSTLRPPPEPGELRTIRFVPRILVAYLMLLRNGPLSFLTGPSFGAAARELEATPEWAVFATAAEDRVRTAAILVREAGEWRVVPVPSFVQLGDEFILSGLGGREPTPDSFTRPAPLPEVESQAARATGERYLAAWADGNPAVQQELTSPLSPARAESLPAFRKRLERRLDEGVCPLPVGAAATLRPVEAVTEWELQWLALLARALPGLAGDPANAPGEPPAGFPADHARRGDLAAFRYDAGDRSFLMLLARHAGRWQVLEPALPL